MKAAVVTDFALPPQYLDFGDPVAHGPDNEIVEVLAAALSPRVRSQASGSHYSHDGSLPLIPGIDGVGRTRSGELLYFLLPDTDLGAMSERVAIDRRRSIPLPKNADPVQIAAAMNPAMSSWVALRQRIDFRRGQRVMVLGADGNAGRMAVQIAKHLGASEVIGVGRDMSDLAEAGSRVDVVLDYLWGEPTAEALRAIVPARAEESQALTWVQIGSVAGLESPIPSAVLRAVNLSIVGSGQGSVDPRAIKKELAAIAREIGKGTFEINARAVPLAEVEAIWESRSRDRLVLVP